MTCKMCGGLTDSDISICPDCLSLLREEAGGKFPSVSQFEDERFLTEQTTPETYANLIFGLARWSGK